MPKDFFLKDTPVHWGLTIHTALCGSGWLNSSHDRKQITCPKCLEALEEITSEAVERSQSWQGLMEVLDKHYPATIFDGSSGDEGARMVVLLREVNRLREVEAAAKELASHFTKYPHFMEWEPEYKSLANLKAALGA